MKAGLILSTKSSDFLFSNVPVLCPLFEESLNLAALELEKIN